MRNLKLEIEYDGSNYCGWQIQSSSKKQSILRLRSGLILRRHFWPRNKWRGLAPPNVSIQETIESALQKILQEKVRLTASGRTDAGVHALAQVANFKANSKIDLRKLQLALNSLLPPDIAIARIEEAPLNFHSRFSAKAKLYRYLILNRPYPSAFLKERAYFFPWPLDIQLMRKHAKFLLGRHDFKSFCASGSSVKDTTCTIKRIAISNFGDTFQAPSRGHFPLNSNSFYGKCPLLVEFGKLELSFVSPKLRPLIAIGIEADGFLYNMVRNIVGTLIEIARGKPEEFDLKKILKAKDRRLAGPTAPARGLYLIKVKY